jgi:hypothetical protein
MKHPCRTRLKLIVLIAPNWACIEVIYSWLFKYIQQHAAGFIENKFLFLLIGNSKLHTLTSQGTYELRVDMEDFENNIRYANFTTFPISINKNY